jgi:hypothetical protein
MAIVGKVYHEYCAFRIAHFAFRLTRRYATGIRPKNAQFAIKRTHQLTLVVYLGKTKTTER